MSPNDKRKDQRVKSPNLLVYLCIDEEKNKIFQGMGRTLNVSEGGILLETHVPIDPRHTLLLTIAMEEDLMHFKGRIAHTKEREDGRFESGVEFLEMDKQKRRFLSQYMIIFEGQKNSSSDEDFELT
ncbi:MAG: PilZ domain-containing protein [Desulfobacteraceae bacterium]|jgi:c-di-GMP-binding flagellar brake protein YcgR